VMGTPYYMAPEQVFGEKDVNHRVDIWAIGVILYECLAGRRPFEGDNFGQLFKAIAIGTIVPLDQVVSGLPADVLHVIGALLDADRNQRPADLRGIYETLKRYTSVEAVSFGQPLVDAFARSAANTPEGSVVSATSKTELAEPVLPTKRALWPYAVAVGAALAGAGLWMSNASPDRANADASVAPVNAAPSLEPTTSANTQVPSAGPRAGASATALASTDAGGRTTHPVKPPRPDKPRPPPVTPVTTPPPAMPPPTPPKQKLPGNVVDQVPF